MALRRHILVWECRFSPRVTQSGCGRCFVTLVTGPIGDGDILKVWGTSEDHPADSGWLALRARGAGGWPCHVTPRRVLGESVPAEKGHRCPDRGCGPGRPGAGAGRGRPTRLVRGAPGPLWLVLSWRHRIRDAGPIVGGGWLPAAGCGAELCFHGSSVAPVTVQAAVCSPL